MPTHSDSSLPHPPSSPHPCPCGLSRELIVQGKMHDSRGICTAIDSHGNPCGRRLAEHFSSDASHGFQGTNFTPRHAAMSVFSPDMYAQSSTPFANYPNSHGHPHHHEETRQYHLEDVNGSILSLSEAKGFRRYVAARIQEMGLKGYIKRVPRQHAKLVVTGTNAQLQDVEDFLAEMEEQGLIHGHFREKQPDMIPISKTFKVLSSDRKYVMTGSFSDPNLDETRSHFSADEPILREPSLDKI